MNDVTWSLFEATLTGTMLPPDTKHHAPGSISPYRELQGLDNFAKRELLELVATGKMTLQQMSREVSFLPFCFIFLSLF